MTDVYHHIVPSRSNKFSIPAEKEEKEKQKKAPSLFSISADTLHKETYIMNTIKWSRFALLTLILILPSSLAGQKTPETKKTPAKKNPAVVQEKPGAVKKRAAKKTPQVSKKKPVPKNKKKAPEKKNPRQEQLERDQRNTKKIKEVIAFGIHDERKEAINRILQVKDKGLRKELVDLLLKMLPDEINSEVKIKALTVLGEIKAKRGEEVFKKLLSDKAEDVKVAAVYAIKNNEMKSLSKDLMSELKKQDLEKDSMYMEALITTLGTFKSAELLEYAKKSISSNSTASTIRERFVLYLGKLKNQGSKDFLLKLYTDEEEEMTVRSYAVNALGHMNAQDAIAPIKKVLEDIDTYSFKKKKRYFTLSMYSIAALVKLGDKTAVPRLMDSLKSQNPKVRMKAISLLAELKDKRTIDILKYKMKYDPNTNVQKRAREALKEMGVEIEEDKKKEGKKETK